MKVELIEKFGMKTFFKFYLFSFLSGGIIAVLFNFFWQLVEHHIPISLAISLQKFTLMFFPLSIGYIALPGSNYWSIDSITLMIMNSFFYGFLGIFAWLGYTKNKRFYFVLGGLITVLWLAIAILQ
ncbi:hypothetical protein AAKU58_004398 [Oxalobacteraceae bacterium GrIS 1.18]